MIYKQVKKGWSIVLCTVLAATVATPTALAVDYKSYQGFTTDTTPVMPAQEQHPSLWFRSNEQAAVYAKRTADDYAASLWSSINSSKYLTADLPAVPGCTFSSSIHSYYGDMARIAKYNAFMYTMEGSLVHKQRAVDALKRAYDGPIYTCAEIEPTISSSPIDETYRANWAQNFAAAYDWMQPHLDPADDAMIRDRLAFEAQTLYENIWIRVDGVNDRGWGPRPHNHRSKPAWGLGSLALVLSDYSKSGMNTPKDWLKEALEAANSNLSYFFSKDGIYREGSQYYIYSHINFLPFMYHYKNVSGVDQFRTYKPAFIWEFNIANNKGWLPNFADSYIRHNFLQMVAGQYMTNEDTTPLHSSAKWGNLFQWRYATTDKTPWGGEFGNNTGASYDDTMDLDKYLTYAPNVAPIAPEGSGTQFFNEGGQTIFRNNWNVNDPSSRYLLFHGVAEADNHNNFDHLSYIIHAENQMMASDSGYSRSAYGDAVRRSWYRTSDAHNTATLDGKWPVDFAESQTPPSTYSIDTDFFDFQQKSARFINIQNDTTKGENPLLYPPDSESLGYIDRSIAFPAQEYFVVADQLRSKDGTPRDFKVNIHGGKGTMSGEGNSRVWVYPNSVYGSASKFAAWVLGDQVTLTDHEGEISYVKDDYTVHGYVKAGKQAAEASLLQILVPLSITEELPEVTNLSDAQRAGGTVQKDGHLDTYLLQQQSASVQVGHVTSDATFAYVRDAGPVEQYMIREATGLTYRGTQLAQASSPVTLTMNVNDRSRHNGHVFVPAGGSELSLRVPFGKKAQQLTVNGAPATFTETGGYVRVQLAQGETTIEVQYTDAAIVDTTAPGAIQDVAAASISSSQAELSWTAPGNDGNVGKADYYDVRYDTKPITADSWNEAKRASGEPTPAVPGTNQAMTLSGLYPNTTYYVAMKAGDESGNVAALSNVVTVVMPQVADTIAPAGITDMVATAVSPYSIKLDWTSTGDDGYVGTATSYEIRYSTSPMTEDSFESALLVNNSITPQAVGHAETHTIEGLLPGRTYFVGMKSEDEAGNRSKLSNQKLVTMPDDASTEKLTIVSVTADEHDGNVPANVADGDLSTRWSSQSQGALGSRTAQRLDLDLGSIRSLSHMKIAYHSGNVRKSYFSVEVSSDGQVWSPVLTQVETSGMTLGFETYELQSTNARYVRLLGYGNSSSGWNSIGEIEVYGTSAANLPPVTVGELSIVDKDGKTVTQWTSSSEVKAHYTITNNSEDSKPVTAIVVLQDQNGRTVHLSAVKSELQGWETHDYTASLRLPEAVEGLQLKVLVWNDLKSMQPLAEAMVRP
ncbi:fibronectin type III domain-containing protein [Paenibacillus sp. YYML68]|uniref:fibronectin type III domain-containing protein n=1 Tax=Paenibacillus sp. YYML68 TaxID=2909250 RepID=UPI002493B103|nr:fibronectin type III domain-containing protein [Paenibacillus sp. YYML68]